MKIIDALRIGSRLENPTGWKWFGLSVSLLGWVIAGGTSYAAARGWFPVEVSTQDAVELAAFIVLAISGAGASAFTTIATSKKIGILPAKSDEPFKPVGLVDIVRDKVE